MKVKGMIEYDVDTFKVGDVIEVKLADGVKVQAMAVQQEEDGMVFCLVDCLPSEHPMNSTSTNEGGYEESDLRKKLNGEILNLFPAELKAMMTPFDNGDLLRLPTEKEIFGENYYGEYESPYVKQWKPMKKRRNRMAFDCSKDELTVVLADEQGQRIRYWLLQCLRRRLCVRQLRFLLFWRSPRFQTQEPLTLFAQTFLDLLCERHRIVFVR